MTTGGAGTAGDPLRELRDGIAYWHSRSWPADLHNACYDEWARQNPHGNFTIEWWDQYQLPRLRRWIATRPVSGAVLTERFKSSMEALAIAWREACLPCLDQDITAVSWDKIRSFPDEVAKIKPMKSDAPSAVFTSKFCHFLLPRVFPVIDNAALGASGNTYEAHFGRVQDEWARTDAAARDALIAELTQAIETPGRTISPGFPKVNKLIELRIIGRNHAR
jgi:hypothetical protein